MMLKAAKTTLMILLVMIIFAVTAGANTTTIVPLPAVDSENEPVVALSPEKEEVVYASLSSNGTVQSVYIVNVFSLKQRGTITDYGNYTTVQNLTDQTQLELDGSQISFTADAGRFYYQGDSSSNQLPWLIDIGYALDGEKIEPEQLAGRTGALEISISTVPNSEVDPVFYENYMLQATVKLDAQKCTNITTNGAAVANEGSLKSINFTGMPNEEALFSLSCDVTDFEMDGITIAAVPFSFNFELPDTEQYTDSLSELSTAIAKINEGAQKLNEGAASLYGGSYSLKKGTEQFNEGLGQLSANSVLVLDGAKQFGNGLKQLNAVLQQTDLDGLFAAGEGLIQLADGLDGAALGFGALGDNLRAVHSGMSALISSLPDTDVDMSTLSPDTDPALIEAYLTQKAAIAAVKTEYGREGGVSSMLLQLEGGMTSATSQLGELALLVRTLSSNMGADEMKNILNSLKNGVFMLTNEHEYLYNGIEEYAGGVDNLFASHNSLLGGLESLHNGLYQLRVGLNELSYGTGELAYQTKDLDLQLSEQIDGLTGDLLGGDFTPISFADSRNTTVVSVQFVFTTISIRA